MLEDLFSKLQDLNLQCADWAAIVDEVRDRLHKDGQDFLSDNLLRSLESLLDAYQEAQHQGEQFHSMYSELIAERN